MFPLWNPGRAGPSAARPDQAGKRPHWFLAAMISARSLPPPAQSGRGLGAASARPRPPRIQVFVKTLANRAIAAAALAFAAPSPRSPLRRIAAAGAPHGPHGERGSGTFVLPVPAEAIRDGRLRVRLSVTRAGAPAREPQADEVQALKLVQERGN
ncbi:hypothetical protein [Lysobacter enzymogenes]|uniref:hypothetical protein n=1 Tax=Lysobacter enzymogenes TaxID=69 RepID=UPI001A957AE5|nr:hypothetical protein [Lysobacter enzymogenes]QQP96755.1 hypothetical protein JHW38_01480 [Lysobacter enzymogenes]